MNFSRSVIFDFHETNSYGENIPYATAHASCAILDFRHTTIVEQAASRMAYLLQIAVPFRHVPPYNMIDEQGKFTVRHQGRTYAPRQILPVAGANGHPRMYLIDLEG